MQARNVLTFDEFFHMADGLMSGLVTFEASREAYGHYLSDLIDRTSILIGHSFMIDLVSIRFVREGVPHLYVGCNVQ